MDNNRQVDERTWQAWIQKNEAPGQGQVCEERESNRACFSVSGVECTVVEIHNVRRSNFDLSRENEMVSERQHALD